MLVFALLVYGLFHLLERGRGTIRNWLYEVWMFVSALPAVGWFLLCEEWRYRQSVRAELRKAKLGG